jgi:tetratricopeptide (TPR) repeat protein
VALVSFVLIVGALLTVALIGRFQRPVPVTGLPGDAAVRAAIAALGSGLPVTTGDLRFESSLGRRDSGVTRVRDLGNDPGRIEAAEHHLLEALRRSPGDPRLEGWLGHLDLARHRYERAERHYRAAAWKAPHYGEAHLGLGVTLAMRARTEGDPRRGRALTLEAIAQFAAVDENDPLYLPALYDRVLLLAEVERVAEARKWAARYLERDPGSPWSAALERRFPPGG